MYGHDNSGEEAEWARRAAEWAANVESGGVRHIQQQQRYELGWKLKKRRICLNISKKELSKMLGIEPAMVNFLESGWVTNEELDEIFELWACALDLDVNALRSHLSI